MKGLSNAGFSIAQPTFMRRATEVKWVPAAAANFYNNYQKSYKNQFFKTSCKCSFFLCFQTFSGVTAWSPSPPPIEVPALQTCGCALSVHIVRKHRIPVRNYVRMGSPSVLDYSLSTTAFCLRPTKKCWPTKP